MGDEVEEEFQMQGPEDGIVWSARWDKITQQASVFAEYYPKQGKLFHSKPIVGIIMLVMSDFLALWRFQRL